MGNLTDIERLERLMRSDRPLVTVQTFEEERALEVVRHAALGKGGLQIWTVLSGVYDGLLDRPEPVAGTTNPAAGLYHLGYQSQAEVACVVDLAAHLDDPATMRGLRDLVSAMERRGGRW